MRQVVLAEVGRVRWYQIHSSEPGQFEPFLYQTPPFLRYSSRCSSSLEAKAHARRLQSALTGNRRYLGGLAGLNFLLTIITVIGCVSAFGSSRFGFNDRNEGTLLTSNFRPSFRSFIVNDIP